VKILFIGNSFTARNSSRQRATKVNGIIRHLDVVPWTTLPGALCVLVSRRRERYASS
jgi:hypothetical protein